MGKSGELMRKHVYARLTQAIGNVRKSKRGPGGAPLVYLELTISN
jgi:hypothetical protein